MKLDIIAYQDLIDAANLVAHQSLERALLGKGIVGISGVPRFEERSRAYVEAAVRFTALEESLKNKYAPKRDEGDTEGYELGAEWFKDEAGEWAIDDKKASFYAHVPDHHDNKWPQEVDLKSPYLELGELIFKTGKVLLDIIGINEKIGVQLDQLSGYARMLHYHKEGETTNANPNWCGEHYDHGVFTGLMPAYYFQDGVEVDEPIEAGLDIAPTNGEGFKKIEAADKSIMLFQVGEFGQLLSNDRIRATKHRVKKASNGIDRYAFALFYSAPNNFEVKSDSCLIEDARYRQSQSSSGSISYSQWEEASFARYRKTD